MPISGACSQAFVAATTSTGVVPPTSGQQRAISASTTLMMMTSEGGGSDGAGVDNAASGGVHVDIGSAAAGNDLVATAAAASASMGCGADGDDSGAEDEPTSENDGSVATAVAAAVAAKAGAVGAVAAPVDATDAAVPAPVFARSGGEFVSKEHRRAGPFKAVLLYLDYVRWLWNVTDTERLDREQPQGMVSEKVKVKARPCEGMRRSGRMGGEGFPWLVAR